MIKELLEKELLAVGKSLGLPVTEVVFDHPAEMSHGDYCANIAMTIFAKVKSQMLNVKSPMELADLIVEEWKKTGLAKEVAKVEAVAPGFINVFLKPEFLLDQTKRALEKDFGETESLKDKKIMVEFAHPNTHKELHIGHMRTLITGEALARVFSAAGAEVFRANYQGDIGPHVAKSIWGTEKILAERKISWEEAEKLSLAEKAHLLGEGYVRGVREYETPEIAREIDELNTQLYEAKRSPSEALSKVERAKEDRKDSSVMAVYEQTRRWSLEYYDTFYSRFKTKFDRLFFESEVFASGKKIVEENTKPKGKRVFELSEWAIIFDGEPFGLHKRVFLTKDGNPTYEAKDMALAPLQFQTFPFDLNVHVVANEQTGYFQVIIKALELLDPKFKGREYHLPMGMVQMVGKKMSSRTGVILKVDDLLEEVKKLLLPLITNKEVDQKEREAIGEILTIAGVKYSILRVGPKQDVIFDLEKTVSLDGDSGPYLEYTFARTQSVLRKAGDERLASSLLASSSKKGEKKLDARRYSLDAELNSDEISLLRTIYRFPEVVSEAARLMAPNLICNFLYDLCQKYNTFYDKNRILAQSAEHRVHREEKVSKEQSNFRILLTKAVGEVIKNGLNLLGIESLERM